MIETIILNTEEVARAVRKEAGVPDDYACHVHFSIEPNKKIVAIVTFENKTVSHFEIIKGGKL